jgi:transposase
MEQFLSSQERDNLKIQHRKERDKRICDRIKAVLLFNEGWDYQEIAHVLLLSDEAVKEHIREYQNSEKLRPENGGSYSKLTEDQTLNLSGAIDIVSKKVMVREDITLNASATITFLKDIEAAYPGAKTVHVFCDNARYYRNKEVAFYLQTSKIKMHFLPPYSPNLNPIERLWKFLYEHVLYNKYYEKFTDFREAVLGFLQNLFHASVEMKKALEQRITDNFHIIGSHNCLEGQNAI